MAVRVTVNDVLDGYVALDLQYLDRIYLNSYVPTLQVGGQVVSFMTTHLGYPIPSPAVSAGANVKAVQRMLGHAKAMTLDVYADLFDEDLGSVAANLDAAIRSTAYRLRTGQS
jgi:hypothetical protein